MREKNFARHNGIRMPFYRFVGCMLEERRCSTTLERPGRRLGGDDTDGACEMECRGTIVIQLRATTGPQPLEPQLECTFSRGSAVGI